jgi:outer membrane protein
MKRFVFVAFFLMGVMNGVESETVFAGSGKIGVLDIQKAIRDSAAATEARGLFLLDVEAKRGVLRSKEKELQSVKADVESTAQDQSSALFQERRENFERQKRELRQLRDDMEEELQKKEAELRKRLVREIREVTKGFMKKNKYAVVLEKQMVFVWDDAVDITDEVIASYDALKTGP